MEDSNETLWQSHNFVEIKDQTFMAGHDYVQNVIEIFRLVRGTGTDWSFFENANHIISYFNNNRPEVDLCYIDMPGDVYQTEPLGRALLELSIELGGQTRAQEKLYLYDKLTFADIFDASPILKRLARNAAIAHLKDCVQT